MDSFFTDRQNSGQDSAMVFKPGSTIGPHMIIKEIGSSWSGDTFLAEQTGTTSQRCILKILPPEFAAQPDASERFQKIMEPVSRLEHQNIVRMDGFGLSDGHFWLRSEVIEGVESGIPGRNLLSLADYSKLCNNKIPEEELLEILKQATAGLYYAHQNNIIHCDLKPANILFDAPDEESQVPSVKISGFGLVQLLGVEGLLGEVHFSPSDPRPSSDTYKFMSPELKLQKNVDVRSDIYSMGLMTLNLLTSYDGVGIKLPSRIIPSLSSAWDIFVLESVRYDQSNRVQDYETFYNQLKAVWDSLPVSKLAVESAPARKNPAKAPDRPKPEPVQKPLKEIRKEEIIPSATNDAGNTDTLPSKLVSTETLKDKPSQHAKPLKEAVAVQDEVVRRKMTEFTSPIKEKIPVQAEAIKDKVTEPAKPIKELTPAQQPVVVH
ncbi:serine/threonine protein kinase, partial [Patescibacteria group bacterium]|nr:serine/threonine protein kinase [Patescibacteria group bacterium]